MRQKSVTTAILLLLVLTFYSCDLKNQPIEPVLTSSQDTMQILMHQTFNNTKYNIQLRFDSLLNDSRCPPEAMCFWEGNVQAKFSLTTANKVKHFFVLNNNLQPRDTTIAGIHFQLVEITPLSISAGKYEYKSTKVTIVATAN